MDIKLIRHGRSYANDVHMLEEEDRKASLNEFGLKQIINTKEKLNKINLLGYEFYASTIQRTFESALIIAGENIEIKRDARIDEIYFEDPNIILNYFSQSLYESKLIENEIRQVILNKRRDFLEFIKSLKNDSIVVSHATPIWSVQTFFAEHGMSKFRRPLRNGEVLSLNEDQIKLIRTVST